MRMGKGHSLLLTLQHAPLDLFFYLHQYPSLTSAVSISALALCSHVSTGTHLAS